MYGVLACMYLWGLKGQKGGEYLSPNLTLSSNVSASITKGTRERGVVSGRMDVARWTDTLKNTVCPLYRLYEPVI